MNITLLVLISVLAVLVILLFIGVWLISRSRVAAKDSSGGATSGTDELSDSFQSAFAFLRAKVGRNRVQQRLPYILLLGEPDTGKTTLLDELDPSTGKAPSGPGSAQWRFLDQGAVIEVPGDLLVTSDGKAQSDGRWLRVLRQLMRHRPVAPVDGIVLTVSAAQMYSDTEADQARRRIIGSVIRAKLEDLQREFGMVLPIHVVVTKCDHVRGWGSFCWEMDSQRKEDIFGWSNPNTLESAFAPTWVDEAFESIQDQISRYQLRMFGSRQPTSETEELFVFPLEFDVMRAPIRAFLTEVFKETAYVDSNFLRGIFFCGDCTVIQQSAPALAAPVTTDLAIGLKRLSESVGEPVAISARPARQLVPMQMPVVIKSSQRNIAFTRNLFELRVFKENSIGRPVTRIRIARGRGVLATQFALAAFVILFTWGTAHAWYRLSDLRDHKFSRLLSALSDDLTAGTFGKASVPSVQTAYNLIDTLGTINATGFKSFFLPASWGDPLDHSLADTLSAAFGRTVFPALSAALNQKSNDLLGSCSASKLTDTTENETAPALSSVHFVKDPEYVALVTFVRKYEELQSGISSYDAVRRAGLGSFKDLDFLFQYLLGKSLSGADTISSSYYYQHALSNAVGYPVPFTNNGHLDICAAQYSSGLVDNFYRSWLENNPLLSSTSDVAQQIEDLEARKLQTNDGLAALAERIRELDGEISSGNNKWLTTTSFDPDSYPALSRLLKLRMMNADLRQHVSSEGDKALSGLKQQVFSVGSEISGPVLEQHGTEVRLSGNAIALEAGIQSLLHQEFTGDFALRPPVVGNIIIWNKAALMQAAQLPVAYEKYIHEQLPLLPPSFRGPIQQIASKNVNEAAAASVAISEEPQGTLDETNALMAIRSFSDAVPILAQLQAALPGGSTSTSTGFRLILNQQSVALGKWLNAQLVQQPLYPYSVNTDDDENSGPISYLLFKVDSPDSLEDYLASQRDRIQSLALDYASPLSAYLESQGLQHAAGFERWSSVVRDVRDYEGKKPGNPISTLESFIRGDLNKITFENGCHVSGAAARSNDYFYQLRSSLQNAATQECSHIVLNTYSDQIAGFFNAELSGKFPFGSLPSESGAAQADPYKVAEFLDRVARMGTPLRSFFNRSGQYSEELGFLDQSFAVREMLAATPAGQAPSADLVVYFRVNQSAEKGGNEIIDWAFQTGDLAVHFPGTENSLRWHYGDNVRVTLRYAKDAPDVPRAGAFESAERVDGRVVTWDYSGAWSLFALLARHGGRASTFGVSPELLPSTLGFVIPVVPDTSHQKTTKQMTSEGETRVFLRLALRVPDGKQTREVPVVALPTKAPTTTATAAKALN